jgi:hypothetical protein
MSASSGGLQARPQIHCLELVPKFCGDEIDSWWEKFSFVVSLNGWSDAFALRAAGARMDSDVFPWWSRVKGSLHSLEDLRQAMVKQFEPSVEQHLALLLSCAQVPDQKVGQYVDEFSVHAHAVGDRHARFALVSSAENRGLPRTPGGTKLPPAQGGSQG